MTPDGRSVAFVSTVGCTLIIPDVFVLDRQTGSNTLVIHGDSLDAYLPYFGRAYSATPGDTNGGINFSSTSFSYDAQDAKNGGWIIIIKPKDEKSANDMQLSISEGGYATLQVTSNNRKMISFYGQVSGNSKKQ